MSLETITPPIEPSASLADEFYIAKAANPAPDASTHSSDQKDEIEEITDIACMTCGSN